MTQKEPEPSNPKSSRTQKRRELLTLLRELQRAAKAGDAEVWSRLGDTQNSSSKNLKSTLRRSLKIRQEPRCCYCKRWLLNNAHASPIEHVLPRRYYPQFALRARNLALACNDCNALKADDDWGRYVEPNTDYPLPQSMTFFHPRYHPYDHHIRYLRIETNRQEFITYQGLSPQGRHLCTELLSRVVGKQNLRKSYPKLGSWLRTLDELYEDAESPPRPALHKFRDAMEKVVTDRLDDSDKSSALWIIPENQ